MCTYNQFIEDRGRAEGITEGMAKALLNLMDSLKITLNQAMQALKIPETEWDDYRERVQEMQNQV